MQTKCLFGLLLTLTCVGCQSARTPGHTTMSFSGTSAIVGAINIGAIVLPPIPGLDYTIRTDATPLLFKFPSDGGAAMNEAMLGPYSEALVQSTGHVTMQHGWLFWRGPRLVGRTRRFSPGPPASPMTDPTYRYIIQVDPYATDQRHFVYYVADDTFRAVDSGAVVTLSQKCEFAEVDVAVAATKKDLDDPISDSQKRFFAYANKVAQDANYPYYVSADCP